LYFLPISSMTHWSFTIYGSVHLFWIVF
jgi:hypothetical protein